VPQTIIDSIQRKLNLIIYVHLDVLKSPSFKDGFYFRDKKNVGWQKGSRVGGWSPPSQKLPGGISLSRQSKQ